MPDRVRTVPGANVSDQTRQEAMRSLASSYASLKEAQSAHANNSKKWKREGIKTVITMKVLRERYKDPAEVLADLHEEIRLRAITDIPTIQQDLSDLWAPPAVPQDAQDEHQRWQWREAGGLAARRKFARDANPHSQGTEAFACWHQGWLDSPERIAAEMEAGGTPQVDASPRRPARRRTAPAPAVPGVVARGASGNGAARRRRVANG
jgi:hypothetical protein